MGPGVKAEGGENTLTCTSKLTASSVPCEADMRAELEVPVSISFCSLWLTTSAPYTGGNVPRAGAAVA